MGLSKIIDGVPDYRYFKTVEELNNDSRELAQKWPGIVSLKKIGESRNGEDIILLQIGEGSKNVLLFACPHPNEPIGAMMLSYLSEKLAGDESLRGFFDITWHIIKCVDPDGVRLNEGWFKGPFTLKNYAENFYRPATFEQVEWTFPVNYKTLKFDKPLPETKALMNVIEDIKPDFVYSLHNSGFGGAFFYISDKKKELYSLLHDTVLKRDIPLHLGEAEAPYIEKYSKAIFKLPSIKENYDYIAKNMDVDPAEILSLGAASFEYVKEFNKDAFCLVCEIPYFYDPKIEDQTEMDISRKEVLLKSVKISDDIISNVQGILKKSSSMFKTQTPFLTAASQLLLMYKNGNRTKSNWAKSNRELESRVSVAQYFDSITITKFYLLIVIGMLLRHFEHEISQYSQGDTGVKEFIISKDNLKDYFSSINEELEKELNYQVIPIKKLIQIQLDSAFQVLNYL